MVLLGISARCLSCQQLRLTRVCVPDWKAGHPAGSAEGSSVGASGRDMCLGPLQRNPRGSGDGSSWSQESYLFYNAAGLRAGTSAAATEVFKPKLRFWGRLSCLRFLLVPSCCLHDVCQTVPPKKGQSAFSNSEQNRTNDGRLFASVSMPSRRVFYFDRFCECDVGLLSKLKSLSTPSEYVLEMLRNPNLPQEVSSL